MSTDRQIAGGSHLAVDAITGDGGGGADHVAGLDVFYVGLLEVALELPFHPHAHVLENGVPTCIRAQLTLCEDVLQHFHAVNVAPQDMEIAQHSVRFVDLQLCSKGR